MVPEATKLLLLALLCGLLIGGLKNAKNGNAECVHQALHLDVCKQKLNYNGFIEEGFVFHIGRVKRWAVHSAVAAEGSHQGPKFFLATWSSLLRIFFYLHGGKIAPVLSSLMSMSQAGRRGERQRAYTKKSQQATVYRIENWPEPCYMVPITNREAENSIF